MNENRSMPAPARTRKAGIRNASVGLLVLALIMTLSGIRQLPAGTAKAQIVIWGFGDARVAQPGWRLCPWPICRTIEFPAGRVELPIRVGGGPDDPGGIRSREGAALSGAGTLLLGIDLTRPAELSRAFPNGWNGDPGDLVAPLVERLLAARAIQRGFADLIDPGESANDELVQSLSRDLADAGLSVEQGSLLRFYPASLGRTDPGNSAPKVLLIGLDGADWEIIDPLMIQGRMPNLTRLVKSGVRARLRTITPVLSPIIWTSMATGVGPDRHGIVDFLATSSTTGNQIPVTSNMRRVKAIWNILSDHGRTSGIVGWWATWPAEEIRGYMISDRVAYQLFGYQDAGASLRRRTWPEALGLVIQPRIVAPGSITQEEVSRLLPAGPAPGPDAEELVHKLRTIIASSKTYLGIGLELMAAYEPDFNAVYLEGTDTIAHNFMRYRLPAMPGVSPPEITAYGDVVDRYYEYTDTILGRLLSAVDDETVVIICSDHGFRSGSNRPPSDPRIERGGAADWHRRYGVLVMAGPGIRRGEAIDDASVLDITPTVLAVMGLPVAKDMTGRVVSEAFLEAPAPEQIATFETDAGLPGTETAGPEGSELDDEIIAKLTALGYVSQEGSNALNNTGITLLDRGRYSEAAEIFERAVRQEPGFMIARVNLGRALMLMKEFDRAIAALTESLRLDDSQPEVENLLGNIHMELGDTRRALEHFERSLKLAPNDTNTHNSLGLLYERMGRDAEAIREYEKVVAVDHDYAEGYNNIGLIHRKRGDPKKAIELFERAIQADPEFPGSYNNMGLAYQDLGLLDDARRIIEKGLKIDPDNPVMLNNLGTIDLEQKDLAAAQAHFEEAIRVDPEYASAYNNLGAVLGMLGKREEGFEQYLRAVELDPKYTDARFNLARYFLEEKKLTEAVEMLGRVLEIDPRYGRALLQLGIIKAQQGEFDESIRLLIQASTEMPASPDPHNFLAEIYMRLGRKEEARGEMTRSLALNPGQPVMRQMLNKLDAAGK